jgi:hypothetical protein
VSIVKPALPLIPAWDATPGQQAWITFSTAAKYPQLSSRARNEQVMSRLQCRQSLTNEEAAVTLASHFWANHMDVGNPHTVWVACIEVPAALPRLPH